MAFIKVKDKKTNEEVIINTDMIIRIEKTKGGYKIFLTSALIGTGAAFFECDKGEARKIFTTIGLSFD